MNRLMRKVFLLVRAQPLDARAPAAGCRSCRRPSAGSCPARRSTTRWARPVDLRRSGSGRCTRSSARTSPTRPQAQAVADHYLELLDADQGAEIDGEISVKPTQLGPRPRRGHVPRAPAHAVVRRRGPGLIPVDRHGGQQLRRPDAGPYQRLRSTHARTGICLQAYLKRTARDVERLLPLGPRSASSRAPTTSRRPSPSGRARRSTPTTSALAVTLARESRTRRSVSASAPTTSS